MSLGVPYSSLDVFQVYLVIHDIRVPEKSFAAGIIMHCKDYFPIPGSRLAYVTGVSRRVWLYS